MAQRKVFVGGSIRVRALPSCVKDFLDAEIAAGSSFLLSDAAGVDTEVQKHLYARGCRDVTVYTMHKSRANIGGWPVKYHRASVGVRGGAYHAVKDREMDRAADVGIMVWDGSSRGTCNNITELLDAGKPTYVFDASRDAATIYRDRASFDERETRDHTNERPR